VTKFSKKDLGFSLLTGFITGFIAWQILDFLNVRFWIFGHFVCPSGFLCTQVIRDEISWAVLMVIAPIVFILGTWLGYFLGQWFKFFDQFGKFTVIGFTNAAMDFGILNLLIAWTDQDAGWWFAGFKAASFIVAGSISFLWNKYWAFNAGGTGGGGLEFGKFFTVALTAAFVNNLSASFVVNGIDPFMGLDTHQWANIGAITGSAVALVFSFLGFKFIVFKK